MIIKLYDHNDDSYDYPCIEIDGDHLEIFKNILKEYKKDDEYNIEDFMDLISTEKWFIREINFDEEVYF